MHPLGDAICLGLAHSGFQAGEVCYVCGLFCKDLGAVGLGVPGHGRLARLFLDPASEDIPQDRWRAVCLDGQLVGMRA